MPTEPMADLVPDWLAEAVAGVAHDRQCGYYYVGRRPYTPPFAGDHKRLDLIHARLHIADICHALRVTPDALAALVEEGESRGE